MSGRQGRRLAISLGVLGAAVHAAPGVVAWRQMRCRLTPVLAGVGSAGHVALTFDDGPDPASTPAILDQLQRLGWKATFFVLGEQVRRNPELLRDMHAAGHEIGVHGDVHTSHLRRPAPWAVRDLTRACDSIEDVTDSPLRWFRPPYGALAASSVVAARRAGLQTVLWTTWGRDWRPDATAESVRADVVASCRPGATVLLHDSDVTSAPGSWRSTLGALDLLAADWEGLAVGPLADHGLPDRARRALPR